MAALGDYIEAITEKRYIGLNRMVMTEFMRDIDLAHRFFTRAEMSNNPVRAVIQEATKDGQLKEIDPNYATDLLTAGAKAIFFWPEFLIGESHEAHATHVLNDTVDMFLFKFGTGKGA
ncbi:MAG: TetR/AcrR family transcriptional regulator C-terminal domain-containing protein [Pelagimonas sp.]|nr:TetR/AcrR family transcriptional regulator C-terminal domain-containing protein [Pelagimonas sp.]